MTNRIAPLLRQLPVAGSLLLLVGMALPGSACAERTFEGLQTRIEQGYRNQDLAGIESARADLLGLASAPNRSPDDRSDAAYFAAYARFREALSVESDRPSARAYLEDCIAELREVVKGQPDHAEAHALLGSCLGLSTLHDTFATMTRGLEARRQMGEARRLAPDNPWVVMQDGLADWATPRLFGGDRDLALIKLRRAAELFTTAMASGSRIPAWGAAEVYQQLGLRYRELGRSEAAQFAFDRAAELAAGRLQLASARR